MRSGCQVGSIFLPKIDQNLVLAASWAVLRPSWRRLEPSWIVLEASWNVLSACRGVLKRKMNHLEPSWARHVSLPLRFGALRRRRGWTISNEERNLRKENIQKIFESLQTTLQQTQTRSWAPSGPVRIQSAAERRTRHRASSIVTK